jgi:hypothetical protein
MLKKKVKLKPAKSAKKPKSAVEKFETRVAKLSENPETLKVATADFLGLLAANLEKGDGFNFPSTAVGPITVKPRSPKELLTAVRYLKRQAAK